MAFDAFCKIDGIDGESEDSAHRNWIEVLSYGHGLSQATVDTVSSGGSRSSSRVDHNAFFIVKTLDTTSPKLHLAVAQGRHFPEVRFELCRAGGAKQKYIRPQADPIRLNVNYRGQGRVGERGH